MARRIPGLAAAAWMTLGLAEGADVATAQASSAPPTAEEATKFVDDAGQKLLKLWIDASRADWVKSTYITDDTEILAAQATRRRSPPVSSTPSRPRDSTGSSFRTTPPAS